jgi:hypothetical protein
MVGVARGFGDFVGRPLIRDGAGGLLRLAAIGVAVMTQGGLRWIAFGFMVGSVTGELGFIAYGVMRGWVRRQGEHRWDSDLWQGLRPFAVMELLNQLTQWTDMLILGVLGAPAAVGYYGVARSFSRALEIVHISAGRNPIPRRPLRSPRRRGSSFASTFGPGRSSLPCCSRSSPSVSRYPTRSSGRCSEERHCQPSALRLLGIALAVQAAFS